MSTTAPAAGSHLRAPVLEGLTQMPYLVSAILRAVSTQSIPDNAWTPLEYDAHVRDTAVGHSDTVNNTRYVFPIDALYHLDATVVWAFNATGARGIRYAINGSPIAESGSLVPAIAATYGNNVAAPGQLIEATMGDILEVQVFQNHGSSLSTVAGSGLSLYLIGALS